MRKLVVIPSDPISDYEKKGRGELLESYYNPTGFFDEVYILSPLENQNAYKHNMFISKESARSFKKKIKMISPDVIRVYGGYWPSDFIARVRPKNIPVIISVHDSSPSMIFKSLIYADHIICMSKIVGDAIVELTNINPNKINYLPNRVDTNIFKPLKSTNNIQKLLPQLPDGKVVLHVGRKNKQKNIKTLIKSLKYLEEDYSCVFIGQGDTTEYQKLANINGVAHRCFWINSITNYELVDWYNACTCFCVPSLWEGFGVVFIEAAACGTPIVTSNIQPMNEYLTHKESAYLVDDYESPVSIAEAIREVSENIELRDTLTINSIAASKKFDKDEIDSMERKIYISILNKTNLTDREWRHLNIWRVKKNLVLFISAITLKPLKVFVSFSKKTIKRFMS